MNDRVAIITGVCGGIGQGAARYFAAAGWRVIGIDKNPTPPPSIAAFISVDISTYDALGEIGEQLRQFGRVDALVNNAAVQINKPLTATDEADWDLVMSTNVRAAFRLIQLLHNDLAETGGAVVNVGSVHSVATSPNVAAYAISKGALAALTRSAALELAADGIRCNAVLPGAIDTSMLRDGLARSPAIGGQQRSIEQLAARTPLGFVATPEQLAPTILYLADHQLSPYTTGQTIIVDGGATLRLSTE